MKILLLFACLGFVRCYDQGSVLLRDVQALTLYNNRHTTARRSAPIPQLRCVGGSAGCHAFVPEVVQCVNKGWDGEDVQWECRTDMDSAYRFGQVQVSCEGYSHPADAYVLKGSCGLEFTLELTAEGRARSPAGSKGFGGTRVWTGVCGRTSVETVVCASCSSGLGDFASSFFSGFSGNRHHHHQQQQQHHHSSHPSGSEDSGSLLGLVVLLLLAYGAYKLLLSGNTAQRDGGAAGPPNDHPHAPAGGPPPPGFRPDFTGFSRASPGYGHQSPGDCGQRGTTGGGFWTGMGTGGLLGYLFGRQRNPSYGYNHNYPGYSHNYPGYSNRSFSSPPAASVSGTRTASGFGGTKRR